MPFSEIRSCKRCQGEFEAKQKTQVYCSRVCFKRDYDKASGKLLNTKHIKETPLSRDELGVVVGSLLGDSSFSFPRTGVNAALQTSHSLEQLDYFRWKISLLKRLHHSLEPKPDVHAKTGHIMYRTHTMRHPDITALHRLMVADGRRVLTPEVLDMLTPLGLAIWFQDDGHFAVNPIISTNAFTHDACQLMVKWFEDTHGISPVLQYCKPTKTTFGVSKEAWKLRFRVGEWHKFKGIIEPHIHESMRYKLG